MVTVQSPAIPTGEPAARDRPRAPAVALAAVCLLAAVLYAWAPWGWGNAYYSAAVRSMSESFTNFLFGSFDPAGVVTVDKPPMALWPQVISTWIFGYHGWALLLPQAVEGVATVVLLHRTVRRWAGETAALVASLVLALTPVTVVINRDNLPDTLLVLLMVAAAYALTRSVAPMTSRRAATGWLLLAALLIGCGFITKMLAAWVGLPAFLLAYLVATRPRRWPLDLAMAAVVLAAGSLWWVAAADLWPGERPYIGGSADGTARDLVIGYNGLGRVLGGSGGFPQGPPRGGFPQAPPSGGVPQGSPPGGRPPAWPTGGPGDLGGSGGPGGLGGPDRPGDGPGGRFPFPGPGGAAGFGDPPGITRMFGPAVGGQATWLLPLALAVLGGALVAAIRSRSRRTPEPIPGSGAAEGTREHPADAAAELTVQAAGVAERSSVREAGAGVREAGATEQGRRARRAGWILWGGWLLTNGLVFSLAQGIFHPYYTIMLVPPIAALTGAGVAAAARWHRSGGPAERHRTSGLTEGGRSGGRTERRRGGGLTRRLVLPGAVALTTAWAWVLLSREPGWHGWLRIAIPAAAVAGIAVLLAARDRRVVLTAALVPMLAAPAVWSVATAFGPPVSAVIPAAGPAQAFMPGFPPPSDPSGPVQTPAPGRTPPPDPPSPATPNGPVARRGGLPGPFGGGELGPEQRRVLDYAVRHSGGARIKLAIEGGAIMAAPYIMNTRETVIGMGGFMGGDPAPSLAHLDRWLRSGELRYVLALSAGDAWPPRMGASTGRTQWIGRNCTPVPPAEYGGAAAPANPAPGPFSAQPILYRCG
ncbi:membrane protein [Sphaerisporangium krabiense]|uniref:4-amino-4-deoxy-L-arabinose transferase-like glycosyltransferase n=1 Tax=Sphaerisporangium krabiense TaxID=763782 RepID=A0A7W8Z1Y4_9ACTN|nr:glycosyltransferase family 39 protein [Sphaerisporangium krabiense]MBB5625966.1 4-amino-4-deoxy-L-arabinose transferase-like glycosyltransferase [Sphaerisporangium krabiense]GII64768.1 membrane protein [Sphaerisporangium krabiense]